MEILTPFQKRILAAIGHSDLAASFYLTGGTALAVYYLQHRFSEDLDFFAEAREAMTGVTTIAGEIARDVDASVEFTRTFPTFVETFLTSTSASASRSILLSTPRFVCYRQSQIQPTAFEWTTLTDMACNKLAALFGRSEPKDFVDVYFICRELMPFSELYRQANQKHVGMTHYWLAVAMRNVTKVRFLPRMIKPVELATLQSFFLDLTDELMTSMSDP